MRVTVLTNLAARDPRELRSHWRDGVDDGQTVYVRLGVRPRAEDLSWDDQTERVGLQPDLRSVFGPK